MSTTAPTRQPARRPLPPHLRPVSPHLRPVAPHPRPVDPHPRSAGSHGRAVAPHAAAVVPRARAELLPAAGGYAAELEPSVTAAHPLERPRHRRPASHRRAGRHARHPDHADRATTATVLLTLLASGLIALVLTAQAVAQALLAGWD